MTPEQQKKFQYWQWRTIIGTMIGYSIFYLVRKNFSFAIPGLTVEYGITKATFGAILAIASFIYGVSKLINGFLADRLNGRWHLVTGLSVSAFVNLIFGAGAMICAYLTGVSNGTVFVNALVLLFAILYVINNAFQGCGFPPCNRLITHWVPPQELATKMSIWNTSHSVGAFIAAVLCGYIMGHTGTDMSADPEMRARVIENTRNITEGMDPAAAQAYVDNALLNIGAWHWAFWIPAFIAILGVIFIIVTLRDTPKSVGLPELEGTTTVEVKSEEEKKDFRQFIIKKVILNPIIWILSLSVFFVYVVRLAVLDWGPSFLQESRGLSPALSAWTVAIFEAFGVVGMRQTVPRKGAEDLRAVYGRRDIVPDIVLRASAGYQSGDIDDGIGLHRLLPLWSAGAYRRDCIQPGYQKGSFFGQWHHRFRGLLEPARLRSCFRPHR